jgi:D-amino peptidase
MKIYIMTDMEGVCGVVNHDDWVMPAGRYYADGQRLLAEEVNAAVEGFLEAGATEIVVVDGHGAGGINPIHLHKHTSYVRIFWYPFAIDDSFHAAAWIGQHGKAGMPFAHIAHTGWFNVLDSQINGVSVGEFGEMVLCAEEVGVPSIFGAGDDAFSREAAALLPGIETVATKWGLTAGSGDECSYEDYMKRNLSARHLHPERARELIREGAFRALTRFREQPDSFSRLQLAPPYHQVTRIRHTADAPPHTLVREHPTSIAALLNSQGTAVEEVKG